MNTEQLVARLYALGAQLSVQDGQLLLSAPEAALDADLIAQVRQDKPNIIALLSRLDQASEADLPAQPVARPPAYACRASLAQQRMLFMEELAGGTSYYNMPLAFDIDGPLNKTALALAFGALLAAHDVLRSSYGMPQDGVPPLQHVAAPAPFHLGEDDLQNDPQQEATLAGILERDADHRFDLAQGLPIRATLIALAPERHVLSINLHHIAADGLSARKLLSDLSGAYRHYCADIDAAGALTRGWQYADYVDWQAAWLHSPQYAASQGYWLAALEGAPQLHSILPDFQRPAIQSVAGSHLTQPVPAPLAQATAALARTRGTTPFVLFQAVFAALIARYSDTSDIAFGTAAANRQPVPFGGTVGLFVNTLVLRYALEATTSFDALIEQARGVSAQAFRHQQFPFDALVEQLRPARSLAYNPLVQIMLVMQDEDEQALALDGSIVRARAQAQAVSKFDLALHIRSRDGALALDWEYNTSLFAESTVAAMSASFLRLLQACMADGQTTIGAVELTEHAANAGDEHLRGEAGPPVCVHRLFEQLAARRPAALALREGAYRLSYAELDQQAERVARHLSQAGAGAQTPVGVCMEKSAGLVIAMLAIYKVGGIYVPLDPHYPQQRLAFMLRDAGVGLLLTSAITPAALDFEPAITRLDLDQLLATPADTAYPPCAAPEQGAYIIYTSGSTGQPKGVLVTHANLHYSLHANRAAMDFAATDLMPTIGSQAFGASLLEILLPLTSGGAVCVLAKPQVADVEILVRASADVTVLHAVPSLMRQWLDALEGQPDAYPNLRLLLVGGEAVPAGLLRRVKQWRPSVRLLALYGMTESAIVCSSFEAQQAPDGPPVHYSIGKPYRHARFEVRGEGGQRQPDGVPGELYIGGLSIAAGYVGQPELTAERFLGDPSRPGDRLYRTGDRVRRLLDGSYEFLGRVDHQVSLRGARIELGEIETLATSVAGVRQAVAHVAGEDGALVLYYTSPADAATQPAIVEALRERLARQLPDYMRPSLVQHLPAFPLNPNGKVDRRQLPAPQAVDAMVAPASDIERRLLDYCRELLGRSDFGVTANFFEVGGHSLLATRLATRVRSEFGIAFALTSLFSAPTIRACAAVVEAGLREKYAARLLQPADADNAFDDELVL